MFDYNDYVTVFNQGDDDKLVETYFYEDFKFIGGTRSLNSKKEFREFLKVVHKGVREIIRPQMIIRKGNLIFVEIDMDFHATEEKPDFPFGHLYPGDMMTVKFFCSYRLHDDKITELKSATWPPDQGVSKAPRLGPSAGQRAAFQSYISAFNNGDIKRFTDYYTEDAVMILGPNPPLNGKNAIINFYEKFFSEIKEELDVHHVVADDNGIVIVITATFTALKDGIEFINGPMKKGDSFKKGYYVHYELRDGLISQVKGIRKDL